MNNIFRATTVFLLLFTFVLPVQAASEGEAAVHELITLSGAKKQYTQMLAVMTRSMQVGFNKGLMKALQQKPIAQDKRKKASDILQRHFKDFIKKYETYLKKTMTWEALVKDVYTPLYLKHFTVEEIKHIIAFYKSPTGKKFSQKSPQLIQEASQRVSSKYSKKLNDYAIKLSKKKIDQAMKDLKPLQPKQTKKGNPAAAK